jgi:hypothetical protein
MVLGSRAYVHISENEYQEIKNAKIALLESLFIEEKYDLVVENYLELEGSLLESVARHMILGGQDYSWFQVERSLFNRRLVNLLTVARTYVDHVKHHLNNVFDAEGEEAPNVETSFSYQHDTRLGYRAMEKLRNFVQHRGFPVHAVAYNSKWINGEKSKMQFAVSPYLRPEDLRADGKFNKSVLGELEALGDKVDIKVLVRDYVEGIWTVHEKIRESLSSRIVSWEAVLDRAFMRFQSQYPDEQSVIGLVVCDERGQYSEPIQIFKDFIDYRKHLERKNGSLKNLARRYVTSEIIEQKT